MYIIVGLGNPGKKYESTRHNMGFMAIDQLAKSLGIKVNKLRYSALVGSGKIGGEKVLLAKPQIYMNLSGISVRQLMTFYKLDPEKLIVIYDDFDLPLGSVRIRKKGGPGTHNGMRSVVENVKSEDFPRIRIGIGASSGDDLIDFVIGEIRGKEKEALEAAVRRAAEGAVCMVEKGIDKAMNEYNVRPGSEAGEEER